MTKSASGTEQVRSELGLYGGQFEVARARPGRVRPPPLVERPFTAYRGYRIYIPAEKQFHRDNHGCYLVHIELSRLDGAIEEQIVISGCVAGSARRAQELSTKHAMRIVDEREGSPAPSTTGQDPAAPVDNGSTPGGAAIRACQSVEAARIQPGLQRELATQDYIEALQARQASAMDKLNAYDARKPGSPGGGPALEAGMSNPGERKPGKFMPSRGSPMR